MRRIAAFTAVGVAMALLLVAQLVLPSIAAQRLRDRLARSGRVLQVEVHAFPAIELLWHHADRVVVRVASYSSTPGHFGSLLDQAADVDSLDASAGQLGTGLITLREATLRKRGDELTGSARITEADLRAAVPLLNGVKLLASGGGQLTLRGTATLLGVTASVDATVAPAKGRLVLQPNVPFGSLATVTLFRNPRVQVQAISAAISSDGFTVTAHAILR